MTVGYGLVALFIGLAFGYFLGWQDKKRDSRLMFRWECMEPGCTFKMASDNPEMTLGLSDTHMAISHREKK